jgi:3-oxoacyl-[acyl-carrier-protein] synthase-3
LGQGVTYQVEVRGAGHVLGARVVSNRDLARSLDLPEDWVVNRTGIAPRRGCGPDQDGVGLAADAIGAACRDAGLDPAELGPETLLLHVQVGPSSYTPPAGILVAHRAGLSRVRVLGVEGACAEPIAALELAAMHLAAERCERVVVSAAGDFLAMVDPRDAATAGLFGNGAGAVVLARSAPRGHAGRIRAVHWETHTDHWALGHSRLRGVTQRADGFSVEFDHYAMAGQALARLAVRVLPGVVDRVLDEAGWKKLDVQLVLAHQPNVRLLEMGVRRLGFDPALVPMPVRTVGNLGPASLLVNLSMARRDGLLAPGTRVLLVAFGLGFSLGAMAVEF